MDEHGRATPDHPTDAVPTVPAQRRRRLPTWIRRTARWCWTGARRFVQFLLIAWATLAIYYSNLPWRPARLALAIAFAAFSVWSLWITRRHRRPMRWAFAATYAALVVWWICIPPSHDRPWRIDAAVLPRATIAPDDDHVRLTGFRHFIYRSREDFDARWGLRDVRISHLTSVDLFISYWTPGPVAHTFVSFNSDDGTPPVCISIEVRPEVGESFAPLAANFKQFELIYVVGDERDIVRVRTNYRREDVFCYRVRMTPQQVQRLFRIYLDRINEVADRPEWYHLLSNNCTLNIIRYARRATDVPGGLFDHRHFLNGLIDRYMYGAGVLDTSLPFAELRRRSHINEAAQAAGDSEDFSALIRASLLVPALNGTARGDTQTDPHRHNRGQTHE